jgi:hypothetical protein
LLVVLGRSAAGARRILPLVVAALAALIALAIHCPITDRAHLLAGHAPIAVVLPLAGLIIARKPRRRG